MLVRIAISTVHELYNGESPTYRLCEPDGTVCDNWLPGLEPPDPEGPLDRGGFESRSDADGFRLGIDRERALFGLLPGVTVDDIDAERERLDSAARINVAKQRKARATLNDVARLALERMDDEPQHDFGALLEAVSEPAAPVVEHRRRRVA
jgi:hypothetical protein